MVQVSGVGFKRSRQLKCEFVKEKVLRTVLLLLWLRDGRAGSLSYSDLHQLHPVEIVPVFIVAALNFLSGSLHHIQYLPSL